MLDAFIIERIRQQRQPQKDTRIPLHIEIPRQPPEPEVTQARPAPRQEEQDPFAVDFSI